MTKKIATLALTLALTTGIASSISAVPPQQSKTSPTSSRASEGPECLPFTCLI